jgi:hypothetical protein
LLCLILVETGVASRRKVLDKGQGNLEGLEIKAARFFEGRGIEDYLDNYQMKPYLNFELDITVIIQHKF